MKNLIMHILTLAFLALTVNDRILDLQSERVISLKDGTRVTILNTLDSPNDYYYLPMDIQVSRKDGVPEISLMIYRNSEDEITGGILHVLMTWGLTQSQETEVQSLITQNLDSLGSLKGPGDIVFEPNELQFAGEGVYSKGLERSSSASIRVPTLSIHKTAASFNLSPLVARFIADEMKSIGESNRIRMKATYRYMVASKDDLLRSPVEVHREVDTSLGAWLRIIKEFKLVKTVRV